MNELQLGEEKKMTVKEVADALSVSERVIQKHAAEMGLTENGKRTELDEKSVTIIKSKIEHSGRNDLAQVCELPNAVTEIEKDEVIMRALQYAQERYQSALARAIEAEARTNRLIHSNTTYTSGEIAKELGMRSAQELHERLKEMGIIFKDTRGIWQLYSEYSGRGFQNIKQREVNGIPRYYAEWTGVGRDWLNGVFSETK